MAIIDYTVTFDNAPDFTGRILQATKIKDVPDILTTIVTEENEYYRNAIQINFDGMLTPIETYFDSAIATSNAALRQSIITELALDDQTTYSITVNHALDADHATNADTVENTTVAEIVQQAADLLPTANVANADTIDGTTIAEILISVEDVNVKNAQLATRLGTTVENFNVSELIEKVREQIQDSLTDANSLNGYTYLQIVASIKNNVESAWIAMDADLFSGKTEAQWINLIQTTTGDVSSNSLQLGGKSLVEIEAERSAEILTATDNYLGDYNATVTNKIQTTVVDNADNSSLFDGSTRAQWIATIESTLVDEATNALTFNGQTDAQWVTKINNEIETNPTIVNNIKTLVENSWKASDALHSDVADSANDVPQTIKDSISQDAVGIILATDLDAETLSGNTYQDILDNISVDVGENITAAGAHGIVPLGSKTATVYSTKLLSDYYSSQINVTTYERIADFIMLSFQKANLSENVKHGSTFNPDLLDIWDKIDVSYTNGKKSQSDYFFDDDAELSIVYGIRLYNTLIGTTASATSAVTLSHIEELSDGRVALYGTGTTGETVTADFANGDQETGVVDALGEYIIFSTNTQDLYPVHVENPISSIRLRQKYTYSGATGLLTSREIYTMIGAVETLVSTITYDRDWSTTASSTDILVDVVIDEDAYSTLLSNPSNRTMYYELDSNSVKEVISSTLTEVTGLESVSNEMTFGYDIRATRNISFNASPPVVGTVATVDYSVYNNSTENLSGIDLTEAEAGFSTSGTIASLNAGVSDTSTISSTFTLTSVEIEAGRLPESVLTLTCTDSSSDSVTRVITEAPRKRYRFTQTSKIYGLQSSGTQEVILTTA